jgi:hypothetical protein
MPKPFRVSVYIRKGTSVSTLEFALDLQAVVAQHLKDRNERSRETKEPWHRARGLALVNSERRHYDANEETSTPFRSSIPD